MRWAALTVACAAAWPDVTFADKLLVTMVVFMAMSPPGSYAASFAAQKPLQLLASLGTVALLPFDHRTGLQPSGLWRLLSAYAVQNSCWLVGQWVQWAQ